MPGEGEQDGRTKTNDMEDMTPWEGLCRQNQGRSDLMDKMAQLRLTLHLNLFDPEVCKNWSKNGKPQMIKTCINLLKGDAKDERTEDHLSAFAYLRSEEKIVSLIRKMLVCGCEGRLRRDEIVTTVNELSIIEPKLTTLLVDAFTVVDVQTKSEGMKDGVNLRENFHAITRSCHSIGFLLNERLDMESLQDAGVVTSRKFFNQKFIRIKTKLYYKQQKFNLFREETEGFAKLVAELNQDVSKVTVNYMTQVIQCLIGRFNLDPNRVLDLVLEAFECQTKSDFFVPLLENLKPSSSTICEIVGFKVISVEGYSESLFTVIALLLDNGVINMEELYPWLSPDDRAIEKEWERGMKDSKEYARKSMVILVNKDKESEEQEEISPTDEIQLMDNQKLSLVKALISIGAWEEAQILIERLPGFFCMSNKHVALKLINLLHFLMNPLYKRVNKLSPKLGTEMTFELTIQNVKPPRQWSTFQDLDDNYHLFQTLGPYIYHDPVLIYKLLRLMKAYLYETKGDATTSLYYKFITLFDEVILPALCFLDSNCALSEEIWSVLKMYPYFTRYRLYGSWKGEGIILIHPSLLKKKVDVIKKVKHLMRRISKENVKPMGRQIGKLSHSMPAIIFDYVLSQIQLFDNLINPVIDALKFLTSLSYDVLGYCILEALSPPPSPSVASVMLLPNRPRTKHDGSTIAPWLQSLASFSGAVCKKYTIELIPLLQYIANQLKTKQSLDLLILKEIVQKMTGIEASEDMTTEQLDAMAGGELLRGEAGYFGQVRSSKKSSARLREAVSNHDLAVSLCILMAQQRDCIIFDESLSLHLKLVGNLYDQCQDTLVQFGTFLANSYTVDDYARKIPPLEELLEEYHISPDVAFFLWRPLLGHSVNTKYDELRKQDKMGKNAPHATKVKKYMDATMIVLDPVIVTMRNFLPLKTWDDISPTFYVTFWSLTLYDLYVPREAYSREISRIRQLSIAAGENKDLHLNKRKKEQERCSALIDKLLDEEKKQKEHVERVMAKLSEDKEHWFASRTAKSAKNEAVTAFLQLCLFPRCIFTAPDAHFCAHFVNTIHALSTPNFSTLICYDRIFCDIIYTVTSCTENEANRYGRFLCALLGTVMKWHGDRSVFDKECASFPGFVTKFRAANTASTESNDHVDYENYRHVCHKWHYKITKCVIVCLESKDFIQIRNSLIVLKRILPYYPKVTNLAAAVERWIERVRTEEKDKRQDLFALATSYIGRLKGRWNTLIPEEEFHHKQTPAKKAAASGAASAGTTPPTPSPAPSAVAVPSGSVKVEGAIKESPPPKNHTNSAATPVGFKKKPEVKETSSSKEPPKLTKENLKEKSAKELQKDRDKLLRELNKEAPLVFLPKEEKKEGRGVGKEKKEPKGLDKPPKDPAKKKERPNDLPKEQKNNAGEVKKEPREESRERGEKDGRTKHSPTDKRRAESNKDQAKEQKTAPPPPTTGGAKSRSPHSSSASMSPTAGGPVVTFDAWDFKDRKGKREERGREEREPKGGKKDKERRRSERKRNDRSNAPSELLPKRRKEEDPRGQEKFLNPIPTLIDKSAATMLPVPQRAQTRRTPRPSI